MSSASQPIFISLDPDPSIGALVLRYKQAVRNLVGDPLYLADPPHLTVYLAHFASRQVVIDIAAELAADLSPAEIEIIGWHIFERDQLSGNQTLVFQFSPRCITQLQAVQQSAVRRLSPSRDELASQARYASRMNLLSTIERRSIQETGFPFTRKHWHPHLTVASIRPADWPRVAESLLTDTPQTTGHFDSLTVFELDGLEPIALESFSLHACEVSS
jgi:2'-5' RNA ligase